MSALGLAFVAFASPWGGPTVAWGGPVEEAQQAELDRVRGEIADQIHLSAYDLIDELVYGWTVEPVFEAPTPVVLAGVTVPVGLGTGMQALLENHLASVLAHAPTANIELVHCPSCSAVVVHSGPEGTVVSRGIDDPAVLAELGGATGRHALFVDVEAEGAALVLRARLTRLTPELPIVWSHTIATSTSTPALLRQETSLKSAAEARQEYLDALRGRGAISIPLRFAVRTYAPPDESYTTFYYSESDPTGSGYTGSGYTGSSSRVAQATPASGALAPPPFVWLESGVELGATSGRAWTASLMLGYSFIPQAYQGVMAQARVNRLVTGRVRSLTRPDLYVFVGAAAISVWGQATASFQKEPLTADAVIAALNEEGPRTSFGALQLGLDLRVGNRIGMSSFLETMPDLVKSQNMGSYLRIGSIEFQSLGMEVTFWF
ncbi:MAG: hypothetical protein ABMB14_17195 [Myxococcota bacterium]